MLSVCRGGVVLFESPLSFAINQVKGHANCKSENSATKLPTFWKVYNAVVPGDLITAFAREKDNSNWMIIRV